MPCRGVHRGNEKGAFTDVIIHRSYSSHPALSLKVHTGRVVPIGRVLYVHGLYYICVQRSYSKWRSYRLGENTVQSVLDRQLFCYVLFGSVFILFYFSAHTKVYF